MSVRYVQILKLTRLHCLAVGYPREGGGWEVIETEDPTARTGFYPDAEAKPHLTPGDSVQLDSRTFTLSHIEPRLSGWAAVVVGFRGETWFADPFRLTPARGRAGRFGR